MTVRLRTLAVKLVIGSLVVGTTALAGVPARATFSAVTRLPCQLPGSGHPPGSPRSPSAAPVAIGLGCAGVRPGAKLQNGPTGTFCTFGFVFASRDGAPSHGIADGSVYIATAGHCSYPFVVVDDDDDREDHWSNYNGPLFFAFDANGDLYPIGTAAYAVKTGTKDITFIRLFAGVEYDAQVCHFGGPTALADDGIDASPTVLHHYGQGVVVGNTLPGRTALAFSGLDNPEYIYALGLALPGDSGSPVIDDGGRAIGQVGDIIVSGDPFSPGTFSVNRLAREIERAREVLRFRLHLVPAPLL